MPVKTASRAEVALKMASGAGWSEASLPEKMVNNPDVMAVLTGIDCHRHISWRLPCNVKTSGGVLNHASKTMLVLQAKFSPMIFKFGVTHDAARRWDDSVYGYRLEKDRWERMLILYLSPEQAGPAMLEAALIDKYRGCPVPKFRMVCLKLFLTYIYLRVGRQILVLPYNVHMQIV